jgi:hypothetical protein
LARIAHLAQTISSHSRVAPFHTPVATSKVSATS